MGSPNNTFGASNMAQDSQIRHHLGSWSFHVDSWANAPNMKVLLIRYEDMKSAALDTFTKAIEFLQIEASQDEIQLAIDNAKIEKLQQIEEQSVFKERPTKVARFFRKGIVGDWEAGLSSDQVRKLTRDHAVVMNKHGYLQESLIEFF
jgi:hypothetical protein